MFAELFISLYEIADRLFRFVALQGVEKLLQEIWKIPDSLFIFSGQYMPMFLMRMREQATV